MKMRLALVVGFFIVLVLAESGSKYSIGDIIPVWADRVGPFNNPQEFYMYHKLPYCKPEQNKGQMEGLGEALLGYELRQTLISISFGVPTRSGLLCDKILTADEVKKFTRAIENQYWYQLFIDDLPVWAMVGEIVDSGDQRQLYLYTHLHFELSKNGNHIIGVNVTSEGASVIQDGTQISFTYSVSWEDSTTPSSKRFEKYLDKAFYEHQIHWFSLFNALMLVVFLLGLVGMILLRTGRKEYIPLGEEASDDDISDESGWKLLHREVFRSPKRLVLFSSLIGTGYQLIAAVFLVLFFGSTGVQYYEFRGSWLTALIWWYIFAGIAGGYASGGIYARYKGLRWIKTAFFELVTLPGIIGTVMIVMSLVARSYGALSYVPVLTVFFLLFMWVIFSLPFTLVGTFFGRHWSTKAFPMGVNPIPRTIPPKAWYQQGWFTSIVGGVLPFSAIFIELYYLFTAFWHYKFYYMYGFALTTFGVLILVTMCVSVVATYFLLNNEDHCWQWHSFNTGASVGGYVFAYSLYYYSYRTTMSGFLQFVQYTGYSFMLSAVIGLLCGAAGFFASNRFVYRIYSGLKSE